MKLMNKWGQIKNNIAKSKDGKHEIYKARNKFILFTNGALIGKADRLRDAKVMAK